MSPRAANRRGRRGRGAMRETTSPLPMRSTTLSSTLTPPSLPSQRFLTPAKSTKAATKSTHMTPKASTAKIAAKPPARPTKEPKYSKGKLMELREEAKKEHGYDSDEYRYWKNQVQYAEKRERTERTKPIEKRDWNLVKEKYRTEVSLDKPKRVVISESHIYGGVLINYVGGVPTREEALALGHDKFTKIEEGGILKLDPKRAVQMSVEKKNKGVHMIGKAFGKLCEKDFSYEDAKITRDLLFGVGKGCNDKETIAMYIYYVYYDKKKRYHVEEEAGIMIFVPHTVKKPNGKCHSTKSIKVAHLVQFCIMDSRRSRGLGNIALENGFKILKDLDSYEFDFVTLFGCYKEFYKETCGMKSNPKWFNCPFNIEATKEENEAKFFYDILDQPVETKYRNQGSKTRFERNIVEVFNKHNMNIENDEDKEKFTLGFKAQCLYDYYLIDQIEGPLDTAEMLSALHPHDENDAPRESLKEK